MALDLGLTTRQLLSAMDGVADAVRNHGDRLAQTLERACSVPADEAAFRTAAVGRRPFISTPPDPRACWIASRRRWFPRIGPPSQWTVPTSTWTATCPCAAT